MRDEFSRNTFFPYGSAVPSAVRNKIKYRYRIHLN